MSTNEQQHFEKLSNHLNMMALSKTEEIVNPKKKEQDMLFQEKITQIHKSAEAKFGERIALLEKQLHKQNRLAPEAGGYSKDGERIEEFEFAMKSMTKVTVLLDQRLTSLE